MKGLHNAHLVYDVDVAVDCGEVVAEDGRISNVDPLQHHNSFKCPHVKRNSKHTTCDELGWIAGSDLLRKKSTHLFLQDLHLNKVVTPVWERVWVVVVVVVVMEEAAREHQDCWGSRLTPLVWHLNDLLYSV